MRPCLQLWETYHATCPSREFVSKWQAVLTDRYSEPQRHYHTLQHLDELTIHFLESARPSPTIPLSIFFHDIVYDGTQKDNEERSVDLFEEYCRDGGESWVPANTRETVKAHILHTKHHTSVPNDHVDTDLLYFLDFDLAILAADRGRYTEYAAQIRQEYIHVPSPQFEAARATFLQTFLKTHRLYKTDHFFKKWEQGARDNVAWEIGMLTKRKRYDAILIPGGGSQRGATVDTLPEWTLRRLQAGLLAWRAQSPPCYIIALSAGTTHRPNYTVEETGVQVFEATSAGLWLVDNGVPPEYVMREYSSYDTIGNAYFARTQHCDVARLSSLLIITSAFHYPRTVAVFEWVFGLAPHNEGIEYSLDFESVPDDGIDNEVINARAAREAQSLVSFQANIVGKKGIGSMGDLHRWMWSEHQAYATHHRLMVGEGGGAAVDEVLKKSY